MASGGAATSTSAAAATATATASTSTTPTPAAVATGTKKTVSASLWWDSFVALSDDLDRAAASPVPDALAKRIKSHHAWLHGSVSMFRKPNEASRSALDASEVSVGEHRLAIKPELKEATLNVSKCLNLDEVQSYILVKRSSEVHDADAHEFLRLVSVQYYLERQCLLKCIRRIFVHANDGSDATDAIREEASLLINEEIERKLISIIEDSFSAAFSVKAEAAFTVSCLEETLIEINLILDILFLAFYDNFSRCNGGLWISLCSIFKDILCGSYDVGKFAVSVEAKNSFHYAKAQLLLVLIETLDFENLLLMIRDEVPFSGGCSAFSIGDILEMDVEISKLPEFSMVESGPLILAWAIFLCLVQSLPGCNANLEIDHTSYAQRAFEFAPFNYILGVLCSSIFRESDGPVSGYRGILRAFISAFIASYEVSYQTEGSSLDMILSIICEVYAGEESLCMQFWDKDSFVDGPIRSVLNMVEKEYPFQISELIRFLSAVCHGNWPAQCVYNYLERMNGVTTLYKVPASFSDNLNDFHEIENHHPISIAGIEGIRIPSGSHGYILKVLEEDAALVRWEFPHSGFFLLLVILAQDLHSCNYEEASVIMDLLYRMVSSNKDLCFAVLHADKSMAVQTSKNTGQIEKHIRIDVARIFCNSIFKYVQDVSTEVADAPVPLAEAAPDAPTEAAAAAGDAKASKAKKAAAPRKRTNPTHPPYAEMISEAITSLKERTGSSQVAIAKFVEDKQKDKLPPNFRKLLLVQLKKLVAAGKLTKVKNSYKLPSTRAPVAEKPKPKAKPAAAAKPKAKAKPAAKTKPAAKPKAKASAKAKPAAKPKAAAKPAAKPKAAAAKPKAAAKPTAKTKAAPKPKAKPAAKPKAAAAKPKAATKTKATSAPSRTRPAKAAKTSAKDAPGKKAAPAAKKPVAAVKKSPAKKKAAPAKKAATPSRKVPARKAKK